MCGFERPQLREPRLHEPRLHDVNKPSTAHPLPSSQWGLSRQLAVESHADPACEKEKEEEEEEEEKQSTVVLGWNCPQCTYINNGARLYCEMCSMALPQLSSTTIDVDALSRQKGNEQSQLLGPARWPHDELSVQACMWGCMMCTFNNVMTSLECEMCGRKRPFDGTDDDLVIVSMQTQPSILGLGDNLRPPEDLPRDADEGLQGRSDQEPNVSVTIQNEMSRDEPIRLVNNVSPFRCLICLTDCGTSEGIVLQECLHEFCRPCLRDYIIHSTDPVIKCPYVDEDYSCSEEILDRELKALAPDHYDAYLQRGLTAAEAQEPNSFHCTTPNCAGWCIYEDDVNFFYCTLCCHLNCLTCKVIHEGQNCKEYQDDLRVRGINDESARATQAYIDKLLASKKAMKCPGCQVVLQKKDGCDGMMCSVCKMEICWATKMARWGPKGRGDQSGGCQCTILKPCHRKCRGCH